MIKKSFSIEDLGLSYTSEEQKAAYGTILNVVNKAFANALEGALDKDEVDSAIKSATEALQEKNADNLKVIEGLTEQVKNLGESIEKMKQKGLSAEFISKFDEKVSEMLDSQKFADYVNGKSLSSGAFDGFNLKDVSLTDNYNGHYLLTQQQSRVESPYANKPLHLRNVVTTLNGDAEHPELAFTQVSAMDRNARYVSENGQLPESAVSFTEVRTSAKRVGTYLKISKRMLKSRAYVRSFVMNMLPEAVAMAEDFQMIFGDGTGENLLGLVNTTGVHSAESVVSTSVATIAAGKFDSVASYNDGASVLITFKEAHPEILDGMKITCANAAVITNLNSAQTLVKLNDKQILIPGVAYAGTETAVASMTATIKNGAFKSVASPNSEDVVKAIFAVMTYAQYAPSAIVLNPIDVFTMETEKDTTGRALNFVQNINGRKYIANRPVIEYSGIPAGSYLVGDFNMGAALVDYTALTLEWADDVNTKIKNQTALIAQEEVLFPVYNPWSFAYGTLAAMKTAITA